MIVIRNIRKLKRQFRNPVITIGIFDGVHRGHKKIISALVKRAKKIKGTSIVITIYPHPAKLLHPKTAPPLLISLNHRIRLIEELGVDVLLMLKFTKYFSNLTAEDFIEKILVEKIGIKEIIIGSDFVFGKDKLGNTPFLKEARKKHGFKVTKIRILKSSGSLISSTRIRKLVTSGKLAKASNLLERPVSILGTVKKGAKRGRILGYPTANIDPHHEAIPPSGVYAVSVKFKEKIFGGVLNIGRRPTFYKDSEPTIEVHIFNFKKSIYNEDLEIEFVKKIRNEVKFPSRAKLIAQIRLDEFIAKKALLVT